MRKYLFKFKGWFLLTALLVIILAAFNVGIALVFRYIIDAATCRDINAFLKGATIFFVYCGSMSIFEFIFPRVKAKYIKNTMTYVKNDIFQSLMKKDIKSFNEDNSAKYISILSNDVNMIEQDGIINIFNIIKCIFSFVLALISLVYINLPITIAMFITGALTFIIPQMFSKKLSKKRELYSKSLEELTSKTKDILTGFEVIRNFNIFDRINELYIKSNKGAEDKKQKLSVFNGTVDAVTSVLGTLVFSVPFVLGGYFVVIGNITIGTMIALVQLSNSIVNPLIMGVQLVNKIKSLDSIFNKINNITKIQEVEESKYELNKFENSIKIKDVSFSYDGDKKTLKDINLNFEKGKKYALVGGSGSGKSTILKLLLRYYDNFDGSILIDGKEHRDIDINHIYKHMSVIQQNVFMFDGTIKDNIGLYGDYSDEQILKVAKKAGLEALIKSLPKGLYEDVGENGCKLSGGEKQRIAIARALLKNSSIMLLDESTSALDNETAYSIEKSILELESITSIVITHKLMEDMLVNYDEILVMKDGVIVESGDFYSLIDKKGYFYSLYNVAECFSKAC